MKKKSILIYSIFAVILMLSMPMVSNVQAEKVKNNIEIKKIVEAIDKQDIKSTETSSNIFVENIEKFFDDSDDVKPCGPFSDIIKEIINLIQAIIQKIGDIIYDGLYGLIVAGILALGWIVLCIIVIVLVIIDFLLSIPYNILVFIRDILQNILDNLPGLL
jgi:tetrahydromethanopterin S-methyltransferase subunit A